MDPKPLRLLLVDDDGDDYLVTRDLVAELGARRYSLDWVETFDEALAEIHQQRHDVYFFDYRLGEHTGLDLLRAAVACNCAAPIIMLTGLDDHQVDVEVMKAGGADYLIKGQITAPLFERTIRHAIERCQALEALRESEGCYRDLFENANDLIQCDDLNGRLLYVNRAWRETLGFAESEIAQLKVSDVLHPNSLALYREFRQYVLAGRKHDKAELVFVSRSGKPIIVEGSASCRNVAGQPVSIRSIFRDVTDRKKLEESLQQSQKLEVVGRLAGGIAHDFNNILTAVIGYSDLLVQESNEHSSAARHAHQIKQSADRAAALTSQLLAFSRKQIIQPKIVNLNEIVTGMDTMLRRLIGENIELVALLDDQLRCVKADLGQIEQILIHLAGNARDAMPEGGRLTIQTTNVTLVAADLEQFTGATSGSFVRLKIGDNGTGMTEEVQAHLFEPFFTTKPQGKGTGLGLATCYGIVKQSHGFINIVSEIGIGTNVVIHLPCAASVKLPAKPTESGPLLKGRETILVAEDEPMIRSLYVDLLSDLGYLVLAGSNGEEALRVAQHRAGHNIDLLLTDVVMPLMGGKELADRFGILYPNARVIFTSGYTNNMIEPEAVMNARVPFLQKPFTPSALARKVREVLDAPTRQPIECPTVVA